MVSEFKFLTLLLLSVLVIFCSCKPPATESGSSRLSVDETHSPSLKSDVLNLEGLPVDPLVLDEAKSLLVYLFTMTDCPVSNRYAPEISRLHELYQDKVQFYLVYPDPATSSAAIQKHLKDYKYTIEALRDPRHALVNWTGAQVTPEAVLVDSNREILYRGRIDDWYQDFGRNRPEPTTHDLEWAIEAGLEGRQLEQPFTKAVGCYIGDLLQEE